MFLEIPALAVFSNHYTRCKNLSSFVIFAYENFDN